MNDCLNDFTGVMTGLSAIVAILVGIFSYHLFLIDWIEFSYYVKTKDDSIFDTKENDSDLRIREYYQELNSYKFSKYEKK